MKEYYLSRIGACVVSGINDNALDASFLGQRSINIRQIVRSQLAFFEPGEIEFNIGLHYPHIVSDYVGRVACIEQEFAGKQSRVILETRVKSD